MPEHLKCGGSRAQQIPIEIAGSYQVRKNVEASEDGFRCRKRHRNDAVKQTHLRERPAFDLSKPLEQCNESQEFRARHEEMSEGPQRERCAVLHLSTERHIDVPTVEPQGVNNCQ